jgi:SAM-dependent methyltransferase
MRPYVLFIMLFFDPLEMLQKFRAFPRFIENLRQYGRLNRNRSFAIRLGDIWYRAHDRYLRAGTATGHYFHQDLWAARYLYDHRVTEHVDVGSRLDGFIAHILPFCRVSYIDIRTLEAQIERFEFVQGSLQQIPLDDDSVSSLSCLHVIEHVGLGRYGDPVDPEGYEKAARELARVLSPRGTLLVGTPVGRERLCFDAHRIFHPQTVVDAFQPLQLEEFHLIDDRGMMVIRNASFDQASRCSYGCGLFVFRKMSGAKGVDVS